CIVRLEALGQRRIAGDQIDRDLIAPGLSESPDQAFEQASGTALYQQDRVDLGQPSSEKIAHLSDYNRRPGLRCILAWTSGGKRMRRTACLFLLGALYSGA